VSDWQVEQLRLTVFPLQDLREPTPDWWSKVVGTEPEIKTVQKGVGIREAGPIRNGYCNLVLQVQGPRIDWLAVAVNKGEPLKGFLTFDTVKGAVAVFRELLDPWVKDVAPFKRIGLGAVLVMPVENREVGYRTVSRYLPAVKLDPSVSSDFSYSINRPRPSKSGIDGLKVNRLSRWSVVQVQEFQVQGTVPGGVALVEGAADFQAVRVELDVNTAAERNDALPQDRQLSVFHELTGLVEEIAARGDVP